MSKKRIMAAAAAGNSSNDVNIIPLRDWMAAETKKMDAKNYDKGGDGTNSNDSAVYNDKESIIRKTTIAYGILELILRCPMVQEQSNQVDDLITIDNFSAHVFKLPPKRQPWDDINGVSMLSPNISLTIEEPAYLSCLFEPGGEHNFQYGRHLEVEQISDEAGAKKEEDCEIERGFIGNGQQYYLVAKILYLLFANEAYPDESSISEPSKEPVQKKVKSFHLSTILTPQDKGDLDKADFTFQISSVKRMQQLGVPASLCLMVHNLLETAQSDVSNDAYTSMKDVVRDLHLLLLDPDRFLFDVDIKDKKHATLRYRRNKLYARDEEEKLITDAFCRVTRGQSEAFFIGGFSGCGKSMLVDTLRARVKVVGGYVIKHKFDALLSEERPLSGVISAVNQLCVKIKRNSSQQQLDTLAKKVKDEFGADIIFLARILQNISMLSPEFVSQATQEDETGGDQTNARSVGYTLLRFLRLVSSRAHPIMLFLDDLQWADETALDVVHTFLSDSMGSCMFFVGTYRDNEADADHPVFDLMKKLESSDVPFRKMALGGLNREDLNTMISDALCMYPRICYSLTDIVIQKTTGNPFFMLEFMKSLKDRGLLQYNIHQRRWVWDEEVIRVEDVTENVMHLLSQKMTALSDNLQLVLKVMACFGTFTKESVLMLLEDSIEYAGVRDGLKRAVDVGFVEKCREREFKFVHDKIREAAYSLIPDSDKKQFHYNLGIILHSVSKEKDRDDTVLLIAGQICHGKDCIPKDNELCIPIVKLIMDAGKKCIESCHHETAYIYLESALPLLPEDCWECYYDVSLRLNFLTANAANASGKYDKAETMLDKILREGRCVEDKLPSYYLLSQIFQGQGKVIEAYNTCSSILTQLGETVPESVPFESVGAMIAETLKMYDEIFDKDWLGKKMEDVKLQNVVKFYGAMAAHAFLCKAKHMRGYFICKMAQVSLNHGPCSYTPIAFLKLSSFVNRNGDKVVLAHRIANDAMSISKKLLLPDQIAETDLSYFNSVGYLDWFHSGVSRLRSGFESLLSIGNTDKGFICAAKATIYSIFSGEKKLTLLLDEIDYYLHLLKTYNNEITRRLLMICRRTVSLLIDKGETTMVRANDDTREGDATPHFGLDLVWFTGTIQNYWLGYDERCCHFAKKCFDSFPSPGREYRCIVLFYYGLTLIDMQKEKMITRRKTEINKIVSSIRVAESHANSNFRNKLELLQAEQYALVGKYNHAVRAYDAAIASAKKSEFIHEQGLACEKAGFFFKRFRIVNSAIRYFEQARICYDEWGSRMKVGMIERELSALKEGRAY